MKDYPAWKYHHTCPEGQIFECEEDVPKGWVDSPADISLSDNSDLQDDIVESDEEQKEAKPTCSIKGCKSPPKTRGLCTKHYARWYREHKAQLVMANGDSN